jgi:hypothetical protein
MVSACTDSEVVEVAVSDIEVGASDAVVPAGVLAITQRRMSERKHPREELEVARKAFA